LLLVEEVLVDALAAVEAAAGALVVCAKAGRENAAATSAVRMSLRMMNHSWSFGWRAPSLARANHPRAWQTGS